MKTEINPSENQPGNSVSSSSQLSHTSPAAPTYELRDELVREWLRLQYPNRPVRTKKSPRRFGSWWICWWRFLRRRRAHAS